MRMHIICRCDELYCGQLLRTAEPAAPAHRPPASPPPPPPPTPPPPPPPPPTPPTRTTTAAAAVAAAAALADPRTPPPPGTGGGQYTLQIDPAWRHPVEAAYEAHATQGGLSLRGFVEACRALGDVPAVELGPLMPPELAAGHELRHVRRRHVLATCMGGVQRACLLHACRGGGEGVPNARMQEGREHAESMRMAEPQACMHPCRCSPPGPQPQPQP